MANRILAKLNKKAHPDGYPGRGENANTIDFRYDSATSKPYTGLPEVSSDLDSNGRQIEEKAAENRCVVVMDTLDKEYGSVINAFTY